MTYIQFKNTIESISKKLNWQLKLAIITVSSESFKDEDFPLHTKAKEDKVFRLNDAMALKQLAGS